MNPVFVLQQPAPTLIWNFAIQYKGIVFHAWYSNRDLNQVANGIRGYRQVVPCDLRLSSLLLDGNGEENQPG